MSTRNISQREARRTAKELKALREQIAAQNRSWSREYPGGVNISMIRLQPEVTAAVSTAQKLGFAIVARADGGVLKLYAVKAVHP